MSSAHNKLQALVVGGAICEMSSFAHSFRVLQRIEEKRERGKTIMP
jgi:hypothetical protein